MQCNANCVASGYGKVAEGRDATMSMAGEPGVFDPIQMRLRGDGHGHGGLRGVGRLYVHGEDLA